MARVVITARAGVLLAALVLLAGPAPVSRAFQIHPGRLAAAPRAGALLSTVEELSEVIVPPTQPGDG
eukprot:CAMPEP_0118871316 /NCGR_PEP_ID=MMETSP1163-20130328/13952_1 /TAXON_ID=124430 /ORGANISM="Phaeomonas parva, Strain CCMP2877" /LENGTH=66 /DNA_ID=CAMNT_0006806409 /DNA_START=196 /DNA_END=392 /DNA_ORIENTATION=-